MKSKSEKIGNGIMTGIFLVLGVVNFAALIFTGLFRFLILGIVSMILGIVGLIVFPKIKKTAGLWTGGTALFLVVAFVQLIFPPFGMHTESKWKYPAMKTLAALYKNQQEPDWFPEFIGDVESDFSFDYMPSIMQGNGWYDVRFVTTPEKAAEYETNIACYAVRSFSLEDYQNGSYEPFDNHGPLEFRCDKDEFWKTDSDYAVIYVIRVNNNVNHPHQEVLVIDKESGKVQMYGD